MILIKVQNNVKLKININSKQVVWGKLGKVTYPCINKMSNFNHLILLNVNQMDHGVLICL